jgi:hypothetical protein
VVGGGDPFLRNFDACCFNLQLELSTKSPSESKTNQFMGTWANAMQSTGAVLKVFLYLHFSPSREWIHLEVLFVTLVW